MGRKRKIKDNNILACDPDKIKYELYPVKMPVTIRDIADLCCIFRNKTGQMPVAENFSELIRNLIVEEWSRCKKRVQKKKISFSDTMQETQKKSQITDDKV
jgi:hypothetical protein